MSFDPDDVYIPDPRREEFEAAEFLFGLFCPDGFECRSCGACHACHLESRPRVWECNRCGAQTSVTAGTLLHGSRLPLKKLLLALLLFCRERGISSNELRHRLGVRYGTAWKLAHRFREALRHQPPLKANATGAAAIITLPEPGDERKCIPRRVRLFGAMDDEGRLRVAIADREQELPLQELLATVGPVVRRAIRVTRPLWSFRRMVKRVHSCVSRRWLRFYVGGWASFLRRGDRLAHLVRCIVEAGPRTWSHIVQPDVVGLAP